MENKQLESEVILWKGLINIAYIQIRNKKN